MKYIISILLFLCCTACHTETIDIPKSKREYPTYRTSSSTHTVNIIVENKAVNTIFETDAKVINYGDYDTCKTFNTDLQYLDSIVLIGSISTKTYNIYNGNIHIPVGKRIIKDTNNINLKLYDGCPWYNDYGGKILQSIQFGNPEVEDWEE